MAKKTRIGGRQKGGLYSRTEVGKAGAIIKQAEDARNGRIMATRSYKAWEKAIEVVEDIWSEYSLLRAGTNQRPLEISDCQDRLMKAIKTVLPYEKPKLQVVKLQGDRDAPLFDLSSLTDKELQFLRRTVLKAQEVSGED